MVPGESAPFPTGPALRGPEQPPVMFQFSKHQLEMPRDRGKWNQKKEMPLSF